MIKFYLLLADNQPPTLPAMAIVLGTLALLDTGFMLISKTASRQFDLYHFLFAYLSVLAAVALSLPK